MLCAVQTILLFVNSPDITLDDPTQLKRIVFDYRDVMVALSVPAYNSSLRYSEKNTTLRMQRFYPESLDAGQFFSPEFVTLHVIGE